MRLLVVHAWLRGNLGDVLQASVLLRSLRELEPSQLDLAGYPGNPADGTQELTALAHRYVAEPFGWYLHYAPSGVAKRALLRAWRRQRAALFSRYDAIISAPGPFLASYDVRSASALCDLELAAELGIPFVLSSHSIGPLSAEALGHVRLATRCVAREEATHAYLAGHQIPSVPSADLAFLYPYAERVAGAPVPQAGQGRRLVFLRSNNLPAGRIALSGRRLILGEREVELSPGERILLATTDVRRDGRFLAALGKKLSVPTLECRSVPELIGAVVASTGVISDRYHPAICAVALGKPSEILGNREPHKMLGLKRLVESNDLDALRDRARQGLRAVSEVLERTATGARALGVVS
jgi:polysaccharide pyruvyl transferase WcaK-like protein